jgi:hypothetical protein
VGNDVEEIIMFVMNLLRNAMIPMESIYSFTEPTNLMMPLFNAVKDTLLQRALKEAGFINE